MIVFGSTAVLVAATALADEALVGKYSGSFTAQNSVPVSITLDIKSADGGAIQGVGTRNVPRPGAPCTGEFPFKGTVKGDRINVVAEKYGPAGDCTFRFNGAVAGNKLVGKIGPVDLELSK